MSFAQGAPTQPLVLQGSNVFLYGSSTAGNAFTVQQLGAGNVASFQTSTGATGLIVNPTGLVGIGKTNPGYALDVTGDLNFTGTFRQNGTPYIGSQWTGTSTLYFVGNVGINTTSVANPLTVGGTAVITTLNLTNALGTTYGGTGLTSFTSGGLLYASSTSALASSGAYTAGQVLYGGGAGAAPGSSSGLFYDSANSRLGIGTVSPGNTLDVNGGVSAGAIGTAGRTQVVADAIEIGTGRTVDGFSLVDFHSADATYGDYAFRIIRNGGANGALDLMQRGTGNFGYYTQEAAAHVWYTSNAEKMRLTATGNVGIGTVSPGSNLHVYATTVANNPILILEDSATGSVRFIPNTTLGAFNSLTVAGDQLIYFTKGTVNTGCITIAPHHGGYMGIRIASTANTFTAAANTHSFVSNTGGTTMMTITGAGNVGIGKSNPAVALDVSGEITASGSFNMTGNATRFKFNNTTTWSGDTGTGFGKLEYHVNRWYIAAGSDSGAIVQFRRGATDVSSIDNSGNFSGTATTATNQSGGTVSATTGAFSSTVSFFGGNSGTNGFAFENLSTFARIPIRQLRFYDWNGVGDFIYLSSGCVGIRTSQTTSALEVAGRSYFWGTGLAGGGQNRFTGLEGDSVSNGRAQVVLNSSYSDLVIASSQANGTHGSTLSFVTADPSNVASYKKFVINVGNWAGYGAGGYGDRMSFGWVDAAYTNPHNYTAPENSVMCLDGRNKRVGINNVASPGYNLDVNGTFNVSGASRMTSTLQIQYDNPTITFSDTDNMTAYWHCNSNLMYLLRGGVNAGPSAWSAINGVWPVYFSLADNNATFGAAVSVIGDVIAFASDERLKTKVGSIENALDKVCSLSAFKYIHNDIARKNGFTGDDVYVGLSAQEVQKVLPEVVKPAPFDQEIEKDGTTKKSKSGENYLTIQYERVVSLLVEAVKEERAERLKVEERLARLEKLLLKE